MQKNAVRVERDIEGKKFVLEAGRFAAQANGAATCQIGETVVLATVVMGNENPSLDYFPLYVEYEERLYAAGKIKSSRFVKREGRASDEAVLTARLVDRGLRPLFPEGFKRETQIIVTVLSYDGENDPDIAAISAASSALTISDIPFGGPIAGVRMGYLENNFVFCPTKAEQETSTLDLVVSAKADGLVMVEAGANQISEDVILTGIEKAEGMVKTLCEMQTELREKIGKEKIDFSAPTKNEALWQAISDFVTPRFADIYMTQGKVARNKAMKALKEELIAALQSRFESLTPEERMGEEKHVTGYFFEMFDQYVRNEIIKNDRRFEGRELTQIRDITIETGLLPRTHGSGMFQRGETQVVTIATLGSPGAEQVLDGMELDTKKHYMHHYNFPGFSVGEVARMGWPSRREVGHGALAERALVPVLPDRMKFPYTIRLVSEVLEANGSTSMASTCGSTLALMDAGVPITAPVAGVAMGLIMEGDAYKVLTDIQGEEDHLGDMDFKVTGTKEGVTAMQMDIKVTGITRSIMEEALSRAKTARVFILDKMLEAIAAPRENLSPYAPRIVTLQIPTAKIKDVIGKGGETINKIIDETGVEINIEDDGRVDVSAVDEESINKAVKWIQDLTREVKPGELFDGVVTRVENFGAFVRVLPGQEGLVHISQISDKRIEDIRKVVKVGDRMKVMVVEIDSQGRINLSRSLAMEKLKESESKNNEQK